MNSIKKSLKNIIYMLNKIDIKPLYIAIFSFVLLNVYITFNLCYTNKNKEDVFRLHVVANSDNISDKIVKLKVANKLEERISTITENAADNEEIFCSLNDNVKDIIDISNDTLKTENKDYTTSVKIGKIAYGERQSMSLDMDKGTYNSIQVVLGDGKGKNFWTLISPSKENISKISNYSTILPELNNIYIEDNTNETNDEKVNDEEIVYSSKIAEIIQKIKEKI